MATYTSFDLQHPRTPDEERDAHHHALHPGAVASWSRWRSSLASLWRGRPSTEAEVEAGAGNRHSTGASALAHDRSERAHPPQTRRHGTALVVGERTALLSGSARSTGAIRGARDDDDVEAQLGEPAAAPAAVAGAESQTRWEYAWGEIKCYAKVRTLLLLLSLTD